MMLPLFSPDFEVFTKKKKRSSGQMPLFSPDLKVLQKKKKKSSLFNELILPENGWLLVLVYRIFLNRNRPRIETARID